MTADYSVDEKILQHMIETQAEFIMEVTDKTKADVKVSRTDCGRVCVRLTAVACRAGRS